MHEKILPIDWGLYVIGTGLEPKVTHAYPVKMIIPVDWGFQFLMTPTREDNALGSICPSVQTWYIVSDCLDGQDDPF